MPEIAAGVHLQLPGELYDPTNWGGEGTHRETNPVRNYLDACQDAAAYSLVGHDGHDDGVPTQQQWQTQIVEAQRIVEAFDDIRDDGIPAVVPRELLELHHKLQVERPDLHTELSITRDGLPDGADEFNIRLGSYAQNQRRGDVKVTPQVEVTKLEWGSEQGELLPAAGWRSEYVSIDPHEAGTDPSPDWDRTENRVLETARSLPGEWQGGRLAGVPEHGAVAVDSQGRIELIPMGPHVELETLQDAVGGYVEAEELAGDLTMWVDEEAAWKGQQLNKVTTNVADQFGVNHQSYVGPAVFTGGADAAGNTLALNREQVAAVREIAQYYAIGIDQRNPRWPTTRGRDVVDTFDTRWKNDLPDTLTLQDWVRDAVAQEQQRAALGQISHSPAPSSGPGVS